MQNGTSRSLGLGVSSLIVVFVMLILFSFSTLSLSSSLTQHSITEQTKTSVTNYINASNTANDYMANIEGLLHGTAITNGTLSSDFAGHVTDIGDIVFDSTAQTLTYFCPIDETSGIQVVLDIVISPNGDDAHLELNSFRTVNTAEWTPSEGVAVFVG